VTSTSSSTSTSTILTTAAPYIREAVPCEIAFMFLSQNEKSHRFVAQHPASECRSVEGQAAAAQQCLFFSTFPSCVCSPSKRRGRRLSLCPTASAALEAKGWSASSVTAVFISMQTCFQQQTSTKYIVKCSTTYTYDHELCASTAGRVCGHLTETSLRPVQESAPTSGVYHARACA